MSHRGYKGFIECGVRRTRILPTPEEEVRQQLIKKIIGFGVDRNSLRVEYSVAPNVANQFLARADIVVLNENEEPLLIIEVKRESVDVSDHALVEKLHEIYQRPTRAPYAALCNGERVLMFDHRKIAILDGSVDRWVSLLPDDSSYQIPEMPDWGKWSNLKTVNGLDSLDWRGALKHVRSFAKKIFGTNYPEFPTVASEVFFLELLGVRQLSTKNVSGGDWNGKYCVFRVAFLGKCYNMAVSVMHAHTSTPFIVVGFLEDGKFRLQLELDTARFVGRGGALFHNGFPGGGVTGFTKEKVLEQISLFQSDWVEGDNIDLGHLGDDEPIKVLSRLFAYGIIRYEVKRLLKLARKK